MSGGQRCPWRRCRFHHHCRDHRGGGGAVVAGFGKSHRGSGVVAVGFGKNHRGSGNIFFEDIENCMNLVEFQCLQIKHPETESI